jgi:hypothetical protein
MFLIAAESRHRSPARLIAAEGGATSSSGLCSLTRALMHIHLAGVLNIALPCTGSCWFPCSLRFLSKLCSRRAFSCLLQALVSFSLQWALKLAEPPQLEAGILLTGFSR